MKQRIIFIFLVSASIFLLGCAAKPGLIKTDESYYNSLQKMKISISSFHIIHQSALGQATGLIGVILDNTGGAEVNPEALDKIQPLLQESKFFQYQDNTFMDVWGDKSIEETNKVIQAKQLDGALVVGIGLGLRRTGLNSGEMGAYGTWKIIGPDGKEKISVQTLVERDEVFSTWNPSTKGTEHRETILWIIEKSTNSFLSYLGGDTPK